jgi:hypothetical protein
MKKLVALLLLCGGAYFALKAPPGARNGLDFDPEQLAALEVDMWRAYAADENIERFKLLTIMLREQYDYPWSKAVRAALYTTSAVASFEGSRGGYYEAVLPDLVAARTVARDWTSGSYDSAAVARAELVWWTALRNPDKNGLENMTRLIAAEYGLIYGTSPRMVYRSAQLRAQAEMMRDAGNGEPDWDEIGRLLHASYAQLLAAVPRS